MILKSLSGGQQPQIMSKRAGGKDTNSNQNKNNKNTKPNNNNNNKAAPANNAFIVVRVVLCCVVMCCVILCVLYCDVFISLTTNNRMCEGCLLSVKCANYSPI